jgi:hypothetical protein
MRAIAWLGLMRPVIVAWPEKAEYWLRKARRGRSAAVSDRTPIRGGEVLAESGDPWSKIMTRHWIITDLDGSNPRNVDMCEYVEALERCERFIVNSVVYRDMRRPIETLAVRAPTPKAA